MTDPRLNVKPGYKYLGYENGWSVQKPTEYLRCREVGHRISSYSSRYGQHHYWCDICKIEWFMDSGD